MRGESAKETVAYWGYRSVERLAMALPERAGTRGFEALGRAVYRWLPSLRATVAANQARVLGADPGDERVALATREAFELYARYWFDAFRIRAMPKDEFNARMRVIGVEHVDRALEAGRGAICVLPHLGNWDAGGHWFGANGYRIAAVDPVHNLVNEMDVMGLGEIRRGKQDFDHQAMQDAHAQSLPIGAVIACDLCHPFATGGIDSS